MTYTLLLKAYQLIHSQRKTKSTPQQYQHSLGPTTYCKVVHSRSTYSTQVQIDTWFTIL